MNTLISHGEQFPQGQNNEAGRERQFSRLRQYLNDNDYGAALRLGLRHMTMARVGDIPYGLIAAEIAANCPEDVKRENPVKLLRLAYELYSGGLADEYEALMREIKVMIPALPLPESERKHIKGEWFLVSALPYTRDIKEVVAIYERALKLMSGTSLVIDADDSITLGVHGMPGVYLLRPGMAEEVRELIPRLTELYSSFTGETLCGMEELYDGGIAYYRGSLEEARQFTYKAIYFLEKTKQDVLKISAAEQLALIAIHQRDAGCFAEAIAYMDAVVDRSVNRDASKGLAELIRCGLFNALEEYKNTPEWLRSFSYASGQYGTGPFGDRNIAGNPHFAPVSYGVACWYHTLYLSASGQHRRAAAAAEVMLSRVNTNDGSLVLELYYTLVAARAYIALGERETARDLVGKAVKLATSDRFFIPLGVYAACLDGMVERALEHDKSALGVIRSINNKYTGGIAALRTIYAAKELPESLTRREYDVARLAAEGLRNGEIAEKLDISECTVRAHLRSVFQKLDIDRRAKLAERLKKEHQ